MTILLLYFFVIVEHLILLFHMNSDIVNIIFMNLLFIIDVIV